MKQIALEDYFFTSKMQSSLRKIGFLTWCGFFTMGCLSPMATLLIVLEIKKYPKLWHLTRIRLYLLLDIVGIAMLILIISFSIIVSFLVLDQRWGS